MAHLPGARSGGVTSHIQGPHLIPNVGREAMLGAEVVRRKPKSKAKPEKPAPKPVSTSVGKKAKKKNKRNHSSPSRPLERSTQRSTRSRSNASSPSPEREPVPQSPERRRPERSATAQRPTARVERYPSESLQRESRSLDRRPPPETREELSASAQEREARRIEEERRQLQLLKEAQEKRRKIDSERKKNLGGVFALSADDFEKEDKEEQSKAKVEKERLPLTAPRTGRRPTDPKVLLDDSTPGTGFEKCWKNWDFTKSADDPGEVARQFMRVTAAKRRGYTPRSRSRSRGRR